MQFIKCQKCRAIVRTKDDLCPNCGDSLSGADEKYFSLGRITFPITFLLPLVISLFMLAVVGVMLFNYAVVADKLEKIFFSTVNNLFNMFFFSVIISLFSWAILRFWIQVRRTRKALGKGLKYISRVSSHNLGDKYSELDDKFRNDGFFKVQWKEFAETLKKIRDGKKTNYYNTIDVSYFFNEDSLFFNRFLSAFIFSIPTMLTGIGIFGTFFGLVIGLQPFENITDFTNSREVSMMTSQLLSGISTSFLSSLWGIMFSLILNFFLAHGKSSILNQINSFTERLEAVFPRHLSVHDEELFEIRKELERISYSDRKIG